MGEPSPLVPASSTNLGGILASPRPQGLRLLFPSVVPHSLRPQNLKLKCPFLLWGPATQLSSLS